MPIKFKLNNTLQNLIPYRLDWVVWRAKNNNITEILYNKEPEYTYSVPISSFTGGAYQSGVAGVPSNRISKQKKWVWH